MRVFCAVFIQCMLASSLAAADFTAVDHEIEALMSRGVTPGAAVIVVKDGEVVHSHAFGVTSVETNVPNTTATLFRLGSTAKVFVALAILRLIDDGKLRLDQSVADVVPGLAPAFRAVTIGQLLSHTSGLADEAPMNGPLEESALHERVKSWTQEAFFAPPGEVFSYSNPGYVLLGDVIAQVTKQPFSAAMQTLVLGPAGMHDSSYRPLDAFTHSVALGHDHGAVVRPYPEHAGNYPPGSLFTSADDLGRFLAWLTPSQLARLTSATVPIPAQGRRYGYALIMDERRGVPVALHTGARSGYGSTFMFLPSQHVAVAVLANSTAATLSSAAFIAIEQYATLKPLENRDNDQTLTAQDVAALTGVYANSKSLPSIELVSADGKLAVRFAGKTAPVRYAGNDRFHVDGGGQLETFAVVRDTTGSPRYLCAETWAFRKRN